MAPYSAKGDDVRDVIRQRIEAYDVVPLARPERLDYLHQYFLKSLATLQASAELTEIGKLITSRLDAFSSDLTTDTVQG